MINGAHATLYGDDADATRVILAKVLGTRTVDVGGGWLIFALPPAEVAGHRLRRVAELTATPILTTTPQSGTGSRSPRPPPGRDARRCGPS